MKVVFRAVVKLYIRKEFSKSFLETCTALLLQELLTYLPSYKRPLTWVSKLILTPNNFWQVLFLISDSYIRISVDSLVLTIKWHLSVFPFILSLQYHWNNFSDDLSNYENIINAIGIIMYNIVINITRKIMLIYHKKQIT